MPEWFPDWRGQTAAILASGPSLTQEQADRARQYRTITINDTWLRAPWADALYACDHAWWTKTAAGQLALHDFRGLKVTQDERTAAAFPQVHRVALAKRGDTALNTISTEPGVIGSGANGGFQALNLAIQFGATRILLFGYDMHGDNGTHWHGDHPAGVNNPGKHNFGLWRGFFDAAAPQIRGLGVEVVNCTPGSALVCFPQGKIEDFA